MSNFVNSSGAAAGNEFNITIDQIVNPSKFIDLGSVEFIMKHSNGGLVDSGFYTFGTDLFVHSII